MSKKILFIVIILLTAGGLLLRFYNLRNTQFDWDQENLVAYAAYDILVNQHFTLIGGKASVGNLYLGPLYSYLAALFFYVFNLDPIAGAVLAAVFSIITAICGYLLVKKIFDAQSALYFTLIWAVSTLVVYFDRIPWNVNMFPLSSLLVACGLLLTLEDKRKIGWLMTGLGLFLGVNSQFSVILLIFIIILFILLNRKILDKSVLIAVFLLLLAVLPLIFFEIRHGFPLISSFGNFTNSSVTRLSQLAVKTTRAGELILESVGRVLIFDGLSWIQKTAGFIFVVSLILFAGRKEIRNFLKVYVLYLIVYFLNFSLYAKQISEYYFIGILPVSIMGLALVFTKIQEKHKKVNILLAIFFTVLFCRSFSFIQIVNTHSLGIKQQLVNKIKEESVNKQIAVVYDMELGWSYGFNYLLDFYKVNKVVKEETTDIYWLSFPKERFPGKPDYIIGDFALGLPATSMKILKTKNVELYSNLFTIRVPKEWQITQCQGVDYDKYLLTPDLTASCLQYEKENNGMGIINIPNCNIWDMPERKELQIFGQLPFYTVNTPQNDMIVRKEMIVTAFERKRCIGFADLQSKEMFPLSASIRDILESAKKSK